MGPDFFSAASCFATGTALAGFADFFGLSCATSVVQTSAKIIPKRSVSFAPFRHHSDGLIVIWTFPVMVPCRVVVLNCIVSPSISKSARLHRERAFRTDDARLQIEDPIAISTFRSGFCSRRKLVIFRSRKADMIFVQPLATPASNRFAKDAANRNWAGRDLWLRDRRGTAPLSILLLPARLAFPPRF